MGSFSSKSKMKIVKQTSIKVSAVTALSNSSTTQTNNDVSFTKPLNQLDSQLSDQQPSNTLLQQPVNKPNSSNDKLNILISFHSKNHQVAIQAKEFLESKEEFNVLLISEGNPFNLDLREQCVQWCDLFMIVATFSYQRFSYCIELANYAKDKKKAVLSLLAQPNYKPTGAVGAISLAWGKCVNYIENCEKNNANMLDAVKGKLDGVEHSKVSMPNFSSTIESLSLITEKSKDSYICITFCEDGMGVAQLVKSGSGVSNKGASANSMIQMPIKMGSPNKSNIELIKQCQVFIPIMTSSYNSSPKCREEYECARKYGKEIIPVKADKFWPSGWLALGIAGKLYYQLTDNDQAYKRSEIVNDSTPMNDLIYAVLTAYEGKQSEDEREHVEIIALTKQIENIKLKLDEWPPKPRVESTQRSSIPPPEDLLSQDTETLRFAHIKYEVTRMTFTPPKPLFDRNGIAIKKKFDVMLSYQWDIQSFVRDLYMDFSIKTIVTWMDIWGGMQGNINEAMATAVENATVVLVFLTEKYQKSINCNLELMYAKKLEKPIIFISVEPDLQLKDWIQELVDKSVVIEMNSTYDFGVMDRGVPKINRLAEAARNLIKWSATQPKDLHQDVSEEVYRLQNVLEDATYAQAEIENRKRFETCTRCAAQFESNSPAGCKTHRTYFMGGNIIAGRWTCCSQRDKNSIGCEEARHITSSRTWTEMANYGGCFQWDPK